MIYSVKKDSSLCVIDVLIGSTENDQITGSSHTTVVNECLWEQWFLNGFASGIRFYIKHKVDSQQSPKTESAESL